MKKFFIFPVIALALSACSAGNSNSIFSNGEPVSPTIVSRQVQVPDFSGLAVYVPAKITYTSGAESSLSVSAPENVMDELQFKVKDNHLKIEYKNNAPQFRGDTKINIRISSGAMEGLELYSACSFAARSLESNRLNCEIYGASSFKVDNIASPGVALEIGGASTVLIGSIETPSADIEISGASNISVGKLTAVDADVVITGASTAVFRGIDATVLTGEAYGASKLILSGKAQTADLEAGGSSSIGISGFSCPNLTKSAGGASSIK